MAGRILPNIPKRDLKTMSNELAALANATSLDLDWIQLTLAEYTQLLDPYNVGFDISDIKMPTGWELMKFANDPQTGYQGYVFYHAASDSLIVTNTPTQFSPFDWRDIVTDIQGAISEYLVPGQLDSAIQFVQEFFFENPNRTYSNVYFPSFSLSNALAMVQMHYANAMGLIDGAYVRHVSMGSAFFGSDIDIALSRNGVEVTDAAKQWAAGITTHHIDNNDVVGTTRFMNGSEGEIIETSPFYLQDSLGGYHLVTDIAAHAGKVYIWRALQMHTLGLDNLDGYATIGYADNEGKTQLKLVPLSDVTLVIPPASFTDSSSLLPEGYILDWSSFEYQDDKVLSVGGHTINGDYVNVYKEDIDGDGVYDQITTTYSNLKTLLPTEQYSFRRYSISGEPGADDYVHVGKVVVDVNHNGVAEREQTVWVRGKLRVSVEKTHDEATGEETSRDTVEFLGIDVSKIGSAFGSALGSVLFDSQLERVLGSPVLQTIGGDLAEAVGFLAVGQSGVDAFSKAFDGFAAELGTGIAGSVSSFLVAEIIHAAGLDGTVVGDLGQSLASQTLTTIITNIATQVPAFQGVTLNLQVIGTVFATYVGTKLAQKLVQFDTYEGQIGAALGASIGAIVGTSVALTWAGVGAKAGSVWGPIGAAIGAFVGYILGGLIGSFFAKTPRSGADVVWDQHEQKFIVGDIWTKGRAPRDSTRSLAEAAAGNLNSVLGYIGSKLLDPGAVQAGNYGISGKDYVYRSNGTVTFRTREADQLINFGAYFGLASALPQLAGGDVHAKRALSGNLRLHASSPAAFSMQTLLGDLTIATDYSNYLSDPSGINALIAANPDSAFTAGWAATFARAIELGINKRAASDWVGGFAVLFDEMPDGTLDGKALTAGNVLLTLEDRKDRRYMVYDANGVMAGSLGDTIDVAAKDAIVGGAGADTITVVGDRAASTAGWTVNGEAGSASPFKIDVAAVIDGGAGDDFISGGDLGNDLLGGEGNDKLVGGKLDDWLYGDQGNDILFAGKVANTAFAVTDLAAQSAAVSVDGGNGNYLYGGEGNDRLYGGTGSDWLRGGSGTDRLVAGAGGDILEGGRGDDRGANGEAAIFGGAGSDQYLFGLGDGKDAIFDESDPAATAGVSRDSLAWRIQQLENGAWERDWAGNGDYEADGSVKGGEDAIAFGPGITMANLLMRRAGNDLVVQLIAIDADGHGVATGDELTIRDWFESTRRVEWLLFADGEQVRLGDMTSFTIGTGESDVILGSYGADFLYGGGGDDQIRGLRGNDFGNGGAGNDLVAGDGDNDWVLGGSGDDQVIGGSGHDTAFGDDGQDRVYGGLGADLVVGGHGNDEVVGGGGDDVFRYSRGDGQDVVMDDYVANWDLVWQDGVYVNGYVLQNNGTVTKNSIVYFDGSKWLGQYDWDDENQVLKRHAGAVGGVASSDSGTDTLEFGVGIDIQDLMLTRSGNDLLIGVDMENSVAGLAQTSDRITIKDWYALGAPIENFVFAATGRHAVSAMNLNGGGDGNDTIAGSAGKDWLTGNGGDDTLDGGGDTDILSGNAGSDTLKGGAGIDVLFGGAGNDELDGGTASDLLFGGDGDDMASYASGATGVRAYLDAVAATANTGDAKDDGYSEIEGLQGSAFNDRLGGDDGANLLDGGAGNDILYGGAGDDTYEFGRDSGSDIVHEGVYAIDQNGQEVIQGGDADGADLLLLEAGISLSDLALQKTGNDLRVSVGDASVLLASQYLAGRNVETLQLSDGLTLELARLKFAGEAGTSGDDVMLGAIGAINDTLSGLAGNDILSGALGNDHLLGGDGDDTLEGGAGADTLNGGSDSVTEALPIEAGKTYGDTVRYAGSNVAVSIDLATGIASGGHATGDVLVVSGGHSSIENLGGSNFGDTLKGDDRANRISGLDGDDVIDGRAGDDLLAGGDGTDTLYGGDGADALAGDGGNDRLEGGSGKDLLSGGIGDDQLYGNADDDQLSGDEGDDILHGGDGNDTLGGWHGNDTLHGDIGDDKLVGGGGNDLLAGGDGTDTLVGEGGNDRLQGGAGNDTYTFGKDSGSDRIEDADGVNRVQVQDVDRSAIWLQRIGNDLVVSVIGGYSTINLVGYYEADPTTRVSEIATPDGSLFLKYAEPLIQAMAAASGAVPGAMPEAVRALLAKYWHDTGKAVPQVADRTLTTHEDVAISGAVGAVDHDDNIVSYMVAVQPGMGSVALNAATGAWTYTPAANRHGSDSFVITVTDADGNAVQQVISLTVIPVNDAPTDIIAPGALEVDEGAASGLSLGVFTRVDVDGPQDLPTYQLLDSAGGRFAMTSDGKLTVDNGAALDYEDQTSHTITVRVTDQAGAYFDKQFTVNVRNVNEAPYVVTPPETTVPLIASENDTGATVASFVIGDPDNTVPTLQLTTNPYGWLETIGNMVRVKAGATIDFEALAATGAMLEDTDRDGLKEIRLTGAVRASDGELNSAAPTSFVFLIEDANDAPTAIAFDPALSSILERDRPEESQELTAVLLGTLTATDPDIYGSADFANLVFSVADSRFEIVNGNQLQLKAGAALDFEAGSSIVLAITVTDRGGAGLSFTRDFVFTVADADDYLYGTANADTLSGQANRDLIYGYGDFDTISGGDGDDDLYGGDGVDVLLGDGGDDRLWGELGDDVVQGGTGADTLHGGDGNDDLRGMDGNDLLFGDAGNDALDGGLGSDVLEGGAGNDNLYGAAGDDVLRGGDGDDLIEGGAGADRMQGGAGFDTLSYAGSTTGVIIDLTAGTYGGGATGDIVEDAFERVIGSASADTITGTAGNDIIDGSFGNDTIYGGAGDDELLGGAGDDYIDAQSGNDRLIGGAGNDVLVGGDDSDVYLIDINSGADEIRNYDPNGGDIDAIGYQDINRKRLWFSRNGDDLVVSVIGTSVQTTIKDWYVVAEGGDRSNYKIDFIIAGQHYSDTIDAEGLVSLMAGYAKPATQAAYDVLHQDLAFENRWKNYWDANGAPTISAIGNQTLAEDGTITFEFHVGDDITPYAGMTVQATVDGVVLDAPTIGGPNTNGMRKITLRGAPNRSGQVIVTITATDPGGLASQRTFTVDVKPQADAPVITRAVATKNNVSGAIDFDIQAALVDKDGSETLEIRISNIPSGLTLNQGTDLGGGVWSLTPAQLAGLALQVPADWNSDLAGSNALTITAIAKETATGQTAQISQAFPVIINVAPTDIAPDRALAVNESTAAGTVPTGTLVANFSGTDPDGDALTFSLVNSANGRFAISTSGVLTVANGSLLDREAASSHVVRVRVTDPSGLSHEEEFTVTVNNVNEAPITPTASILIPIGAENSALAGQTIATLNSTDPDGTVPGYVITSDPRGWFTIVGSQLKLRTGLSFDFEALKAAGMAFGDIDQDGNEEVIYTVQVKATDGSLQSGEANSVTIRIEDANDAPNNINPDRALTVAENSANSTFIGNFIGVDQDVGDGLTYTLVNNAGGRFALTSAGRLTVANTALLNYEAGTSHAITVRVSDGIATYDKTFNVAVTNVNETPTDPGVSQTVGSMTEGITVAQTVATYSATDPDGTTPTFVETLDPWNWFDIVGNSFRLKAGLNLDFDALVAHGTDWWRKIEDSDGDGQLEVAYLTAVKSTDGTLNSVGDGWLWFRVEDANEAPVIGSSAFSASEAAPGAGQTLIGTVAVNDPDSQDYNRNFQFSLTGGDTSRFSINQTTGQLYLQGSLDYEAATAHQVQVTVKDRGGSGFTVTKTLTINVTNVNEVPYFTVDFNRASIAATTTVTLSALDPEGTALSYTLLSWSADWGTVTLNGNQLTIPASTRRYEAYYSSATVKVVDATGLSSIRTFSFVAPRNQAGNPPVILDLDGNGVELIPMAGSTIRFDMDGDLTRDKSGWVGAGDGLLVLDRDRNGTIDNGSEISFAADKAGAVSDLEGLAAYDSNSNGLFDAGDARFADFQIWQDRNQDGVSQAQELSALAGLGIVSIDLHGLWTGADYSNAPDNVLYATSSFTRADGSTGQVGDVFLAFVPGDLDEDSPGSSGNPLDTDDDDLVVRRGGGRYRDRKGLGDFAWEDDGPAWHGDRGSGDAAPGRVDRRADRDLTPSQILAMAMRDSDNNWRETGMGEPSAVPQSYAPNAAGLDRVDEEEPAHARRSGARSGGGRAEPAEAFQPRMSRTRSALHDQLALNEKKRFQMVEAMSSFSAQPYGQFGLGTGKDPKAVELLTALPDFRIGA